MTLKIERALIAVACALAVVSASAGAKPATKGTAARASEPAACAKLRTDYEMANKRMSLYDANAAVGGGSARITANGQIEAALSEARLTMDLMRDNRCKMPTSAPSVGQYRMQALDCVTDMIGATARAPSCILENWKPES